MSAPYDQSFNQPPGFPPQQYQQPQGYPQAPQGYPQGFPYNQPPQGYPQQYGQPQQNVPAPKTGSLDDFMGESTGGGPFIRFPGAKRDGRNWYGLYYIVRTSRKLSNSDVRHQTDLDGVPQNRRDGRPRWELVVPLVVLETNAQQMGVTVNETDSSPWSPGEDGEARWSVKGRDWADLKQAMAQAGAPEGPPEEGSIMFIRFLREQDMPRASIPRKVKEIVYQRPTALPQGAPQQAPQGQPQPTPQFEAPAAPQAPADPWGQAQQAMQQANAYPQGQHPDMSPSQQHSARDSAQLLQQAPQYPPPAPPPAVDPAQLMAQAAQAQPQQPPTQQPAEQPGNGEQPPMDAATLIAQLKGSQAPSA